MTELLQTDVLIIGCGIAGATAALQLATFDEGIVLPHERTFSGPKTDRLNLTRATQGAWGHIFILYPDADNRVNALLQPHLERTASVTARERVIEPDVEQRFWVLDDPNAPSFRVQNLSLPAEISGERMSQRSQLLGDEFNAWRIRRPG